jgi:hypothetical protein
MRPLLTLWWLALVLGVVTSWLSTHSATTLDGTPAIEISNAPGGGVVMCMIPDTVQAGAAGLHQHPR